MNEKQIILQQKIDQLKKESDRMPEQRSKEWLEMRKFGFGGSEVATLIGWNPYMKAKELIMKKLGLIESNWNGNVYTRWGTVQEENTKCFMEMIFNTYIVEINILKGEIEGQLYSPDGIGAVNLRYYDYEHEKALNNYFYILFEFKAPFCRIPSGIIPREYMPQVQSGLSVLKNADKALFVNSLYRLCSLTQIGLNSSYNINFHSSDKNKRYESGSDPVALGIIVVYQDDISQKKFKEFYEQHKEFDVIEDEEYDFSDNEDNNFNDTEDERDEFDFDDDGNDFDDFDEDENNNFSDTADEIEDKYSLNMLSIDQIIKYPPPITIAEKQQFTINHQNMINMVANNDYIYDPKTFQLAIRLPYEMDFGDTENDIVDRLFELVTNNNEKKYISELKIEYLEQFIIRKNLNKVEFINSQNIINENDNIDNSILENNIHKFFVNQIVQCRTKLEKVGNCEIIGFIPWKLYNCDIISVNRDPELINLIQTKISETIKILNEIHAAPANKKNELFQKYYG